MKNRLGRAIEIGAFSCDHECESVECPACLEMSLYVEWFN